MRRILAAAAVLLAAHGARAEGLRWEAVWTPAEGGRSLEPVRTVSDGLLDRDVLHGRPVARTQGGFVYFEADDRLFFGAGLEMTLEVEYYDEEAGEVWLQYDAFTERGRSSYHESAVVQSRGEGGWQTARFEMPHAWLANGQNDGADMRLVQMNAVWPIARVRLYVDAFEGRVFETREGMRQAGRDLRLRLALEDAADALARRRKLEALQAHAPSLMDDAAARRAVEAATGARETLKGMEGARAPGNDAALEAVLARLDASVGAIRNAELLLERKSELAGFMGEVDRGRRGWVWFARPALTSGPLPLPWTKPSPAEVRAPVRLALTPGEYEPALLGLLASERVERVQAAVSDLRGPDGARLPAGDVDIRLLVNWYQAGRRNETVTGRELVPELLTHGASVVRADLVTRENVLQFDDLPRDAETLQPFDVEAFETRCLWLTVKAPAEAAPGRYAATVTLTPGGDEPPEPMIVPIEVEVYPFTLEPHPLIASMYYSGNYQSAPEGENYRARLIDMREHGLTCPAFYLPKDMDVARRELALRQECGVNQGPLLLHGGYSVAAYLRDTAPEEAKREKLRATIEMANGLADEFGYDGAYIYGIDEAAGEELRSEVPVFDLAGEMGGGVSAAVLSDFGEIAVEHLQLPIYSGFPPRDLVAACHANGFRMMRYGSPQGGTEDAYVWRYGYGLGLWELNLDGGCTWTYRSAVAGDPWDDFDDPDGTYRDFMMTYPAYGAPIPTVQWEAYREANDDLRYMATLEKRLAYAIGDAGGRVAEIRDALAELREEGVEGRNLGALRTRIAGWIQELGG